MSTLPLNLLAQAVPMLTRHELVALTERLIEHLDDIDGDPDAEEIPVEDAQLTYDLPPEEDPGDPDLEDIDEREPDADTAGDPAWAEWHTLNTAQRRAGDMLADWWEDAEDDDNDSGVEDDPLGIDPEEDLGVDDVGEPEEPEAAVSDPTAYGEHVQRIQRTRCFPRYGYSVWGRSRWLKGYKLIYEPIVPTRRKLIRRKRGVPRRPRA